MTKKKKKNILILISLLTLLSPGIVSCNDPSEEVCGNDILDAGESCDGFDFGSNTCGDIASLGKYAGGFLACKNDCTLDVSTCDLNYGYPEEPATGFGTESGDIIQDLNFELGNTVAAGFANRNGEDTELNLNHIYREGVNKGGKWKGALLFFTAGWCPPCKIEATALADVTYQYEQKGILFIGIVLQDNNYLQSTGEYAQEHSDNYGWTFPAVAGHVSALSEYWPGGSIAFPMNMLLDLSNMEIKAVQTGALMNSNAISEFIAPVIGE